MPANPTGGGIFPNVPHFMAVRGGPGFEGGDRITITTDGRPILWRPGSWADAENPRVLAGLAKAIEQGALIACNDAELPSQRPSLVLVR